MAAAFLVVLLGLGVAFLAEGLGVAFLADDLGVAFLALAGFLVADFFTCRHKHGSRTRAQGTAAGAGGLHPTVAQVPRQASYRGGKPR